MITIEQNALQSFINGEREKKKKKKRFAFEMHNKVAFITQVEKKRSDIFSLF